MINTRLAIVALATGLTSVAAQAAPAERVKSRMIGVNVVLNRPADAALLTDLARYGNVRDVIPQIDALTLQARESDLPAIRALPYVAAAGADAERRGGPLPGAPTSLAEGRNTWNLDAVNVTDTGVTGRTVAEDGTGVYVAVLDTGLVKNWRAYFPQSRVATHLARAFGGGGGDVGFVSEQPNKWERDTDSHGTHVTSTVLGYDLLGTPVNGVAPGATVIPVKVLGQTGSGWSSVIARGIVYVADLKAGPLAGAPIVINMSLGGSRLDPVEKAAIDYAIARGVVVVASAGNEGTAGMGYPGAYGPVISVAASGWTGEWQPPAEASWWRSADVAEPTAATDFYMTSFSSRELPGQELDVAAPGSWVVGPFQTNGQLSFYFLGGTSMAAPHVAGIAALVLQRNATLGQADVESILRTSAIPMPPGCRDILTISLSPATVCWDEDATGFGLATADAALGMTPAP
jgi:subtilisin family serine protease